MHRMKKLQVSMFFAASMVLSSCGQQDLTVDELKAAINVAVEKRDLKTAIIHYRGLIAQQDSPSNRIKLANLYFDVFNHSAAIKEYVKAKESGAGASEWLIPLAVSWSLVGESEKIAAEYVGIDSKYDDIKADAVAMIGWSLIRANQLPEALEKLKEAEGLYTDSQALAFAKAHYRVTIKQFSDAELLLNKVTLNALESEVLLLRSRIASGIRDLPKAIKYLQQGRGKFPNDPRILVRLTNLQIAANNEIGVEKNLSVLRARFPNTLQQHLLEGKWLYIQRKDSAARDEFQKAASLASRHPEVNMFLGLVNARMKQWDKAASYLNKTLLERPDHLQSLMALTKVYLMGLSQPQAAVDLLTTHQDKFTRDLSFQLHFIDALMANGQHTDALQRIDAIQANNPNLSVLNISRALARYQLGDTEQALSALSEATHDDNNSLTASVLLARIYISRKEVSKAEEQLTKISQLRPDSLVLQELEASLSYAKGDQEKAKEEFKKLIVTQPNLKRGWMQLASILIQSNEMDELKTLALNMESQFGDDVDLIMLKIEVARLNSDHTQELALMQEVWERDPTKLLVGRQLVNTYLASKPFLAEQVARKMVSYHPENDLAHFDMGKVFLRIRKLRESIESFDRAIVLNEQRLSNHLGLIQAFQLGGQLSKAENKFRQLLEKWPDDQSLIERNIVFLIDNGKPEEARKLTGRIDNRATEFQLIAQLESAGANHKKALQNIKQSRKLEDSSYRVKLHSQIADAAGDVVEALDVLQQWLNSHSDDHDIRLSLSDFRLKNSDLESAYEGYVTLLKEFPDNPILLNNLTWLLIEQNDQRALKYAERLRTQSPEAPSFIDTMAWAEILLGDASKGAAELEKLLSRNIQFPFAKYHLAVGFQKTGRSAKAKVQLEELLAVTQDTDIRSKAEQLLESL